MFLLFLNFLSNFLLIAQFSKKEEFRKYLERSGVIDNLTKGLIL
jgi:hypothetical protein